MSLTLGEKLRQAREERGITISEVAEQTRISRLYLENIENNDYKILPGGIFNKGFVKSYAKYVGIDPQEALSDYTQLMAEQSDGGDSDENKVYRPEVLTDDYARSTSIPTIIFAVIILGLLAGGIFALVRYYQDLQNQAVLNPTNANKASTVNSNVNATNSNTNVSQPIPATNEIKVELKAISEPVSIEATIDGKKASTNVSPETPQTFTGQQSVKFVYSRYKAQNLQMTLNGKQITLPSVPANPKRNGIDFEINKENIVQILQSGAITVAVPPTATNTNTNALPR